MLDSISTRMTLVSLQCGGKNLVVNPLDGWRLVGSSGESMHPTRIGEHVSIQYIAVGTNVGTCSVCYVHSRYIPFGDLRQYDTLTSSRIQCVSNLCVVCYQSAKEGMITGKTHTWMLTGDNQCVTIRNDADDYCTKLKLALKDSVARRPRALFKTVASSLGGCVFEFSRTCNNVNRVNRLYRHDTPRPIVYELPNVNYERCSSRDPDTVAYVEYANGAKIMYVTDLRSMDATKIWEVPRDGRVCDITAFVSENILALSGINFIQYHDIRNGSDPMFVMELGEKCARVAMV